MDTGGCFQFRLSLGSSTCQSSSRPDSLNFCLLGLLRRNLVSTATSTPPRSRLFERANQSSELARPASRVARDRRDVLGERSAVELSPQVIHFFQELSRCSGSRNCDRCNALLIIIFIVVAIQLRRRVDQNAVHYNLNFIKKSKCREDNVVRKYKGVRCNAV